jgi:hypothetical protein
MADVRAGLENLGFGFAAAIVTLFKLYPFVRRRESGDPPSILISLTVLIVSIVIAFNLTLPSERARLIWHIAGWALTAWAFQEVWAAAQGMSSYELQGCLGLVFGGLFLLLFGAFVSHGLHVLSLMSALGKGTTQ